METPGSASHYIPAYPGSFFLFAGGSRRRWARDVETVVRLARNLGFSLSAATLRGLEYGWTRSPDPLTLLALAQVYERTFEDVCEALFESRREAGEKIRLSKPLPTAPPTAIEGFVALPLPRNPVAAGQPLVVAPDPDRDRTLAFRESIVRKFTKPMCLRIGPREESMVPTIEPGDVIVIDRNPDRRLAPRAGHIYAVDFGQLGEEGGAVKRIDLSGSTLVVTSDNPDKRAYPPQVFDVSPAPQGFLGHLIAREYSQEECRNGEARSRCGGGGGSPEGDRRCCRERQQRAQRKEEK